MNDLTISVLHDALRGLAMRQRAIADNVANIQTPGYLAKRVSFEASLQREIDTAGEAPADIVQATSQDPVRQDGNNVNLDDETVSATETNLRYQAAADAISAKFHLLRTAIRGQ